jgi:hypothetical protein
VYYGTRDSFLHQITTKFKHHVHWLYIQIFAHEGSLKSLHILILGEWGCNEHYIVQIHKFHGVWWLEYGCGLHEGVDNLMDDLVKQTKQIHDGFNFNQKNYKGFYFPFTLFFVLKS